MYVNEVLKNILFHNVIWRIGVSGNSVANWKQNRWEVCQEDFRKQIEALLASGLTRLRWQWKRPSTSILASWLHSPSQIDTGKTPDALEDLNFVGPGLGSHPKVFGLHLRLPHGQHRNCNKKTQIEFYTIEFGLLIIWLDFDKSLCTVFENHRKSLIQHCERSQ